MACIPRLSVVAVAVALGMALARTPAEAAPDDAIGLPPAAAGMGGVAVGVGILQLAFVGALLIQHLLMRRTRRRLRAQEQTLRLVLDLVPHQINARDAEGRFLFANKATAESLNRSPEELIGQRLIDIAPDADEAAAWLADDHEVIETAIAKVIPEERFTDANGGRHWHSTVKVPFTADDGAVLGVLACSVNVTDLKNATGELRFQQDVLADLVDSLPVGIIAKDVRDDFRIVLWNRAAAALSGLKAADVVGKTDYDLVEREVAEQMRQTDLRSIREGNAVVIGDTWIPELFGNRTVHVTALPVSDPAGTVQTLFCLIEDVTERRRLEQQLRHSQKMEAVGQLAGGVAHDFNNLLQVILGYISYLRRDLGNDSPAAKKADQIRKAADRAMALVRQLLMFSRRDEANVAYLDLNQVVGDSLKMLGRVLGDQYQVVFRCGRDLKTIHADQGQIEQALVNLCVNSRDAMPDGGHIVIETGIRRVEGAERFTRPRLHTGDYVYVAVTDWGEGVPEEIRERIFEPFFTTKEAGKGTGLGLATVYAILERHGGGIEMNTTPGQTTTFRLLFPVREPEEGTATGTDAAAKPPAKGGAETILLAEDEDMVRDLCATILRDAGYSVLTASNGARAIRLYRDRAEDIDLLLLDVLMPGKTGLDVYDAAKALNPNVRILFSSAISDEAKLGRSAKMIAGEMLRKPYTEEALLRKVREVLDQTPNGE